MLRIVQMSKRGQKIGGTRSAGGSGRAQRTFNQRVAVRVSYSANKNPGQWKAHGRYVARESATQGGKAAEAGLAGAPAGFDPVHPPNTLATTTAATISRLTALLLSVEMVWFDDREVCRSTSPFRACLGRYRPDRRPGSSSREDPQLRDSAGFTPDFADRSVAPLP